MADAPYTPATLRAAAFNCPLCGAYARQLWYEVSYATNTGYRSLGRFCRSVCSHCNKDLVWFDDTIVVPDVSAAPPANSDLNEDIQADYAEAASIVAKSPRGAAALLRLCVAKLCGQLGESGKDLNADIGALVKRGLSVGIQQALDVVRVIGNNAVHPGHIDLRDDVDTATTLFTLINAIADRLISEPRRITELYGGLPESVRKQIEERDNIKK